MGKGACDPDLVHAAFEAADAWQFQHDLIPDIQRTYPHRRAGHDDVARLQREARGHVLNHRHYRVEHQGAVAVLADFAVDGQANANVSQILERAALYERGQHAGAVE